MITILGSCPIDKMDSAVITVKHPLTNNEIGKITSFVIPVCLTKHQANVLDMICSTIPNGLRLG